MKRTCIHLTPSEEKLNAFNINIFHKILHIYSPQVSFYRLNPNKMCTLFIYPCITNVNNVMNVY